MEEDAVFFTDHSGWTNKNLMLEQLPSYQSLLYRRKSSQANNKRKGSLDRRTLSSTGSSKWVVNTFKRVTKSQKSQTEQQAIRELKLTMAEKRAVKQQRLEENRDQSSLNQWKQNSRRYLKRLRDDAEEFLSSMKLWRGDIHQIEGMFGPGILSYFSFLRFLVVLNLIIFLLMFSFVMLPIVLVKHTSGNITYNKNEGNACSVYPHAARRGLVLYHQHISDFLSGEGFMEKTFLFYGFYDMETINFPNVQYNLALAYLLTTIAYLLLSLIWIVKRSATGLKRRLVQDEDRFQSYCNKIFAGWDFCVTSESAARLKRSSMLYEIKTDLEEERIKQKIADRTRKERVRIYLVRAILNVFVICVLAGCFCSIYYATSVSQEAEIRKTNGENTNPVKPSGQASPQKTLETEMYFNTTAGPRLIRILQRYALVIMGNAVFNQANFIMDLIYEYLPSIVITLANFITPILFSVIIKFEDYSPAYEICFTLMRCVFMRLTSICILLFTLWSRITVCEGFECLCGYNHKLYSCWETRVGQEMYKLTIFDFIIIVAVTLFVEFPRKLVVNYLPCSLTKWWGLQEFDIPQNVLGIVYGQTICWIGTFYSPMLPAICTIKYFFIFYVKKLSLIKNCRPSTRPFRASSSNFFFLGVLLIGLALACMPVAIGLAQINSSQACGAFVRYNTSWGVLPAAISALPDVAQRFFTILSEEAFAVSLLAVTCLAMFYVIALAGAHKKVIGQLREQLAIEAKDKRFLIERLCQAQLSRAVRSPVSRCQPCSPTRQAPSYHTSFSSNYSEAVFLAHSPPHSSTHV